MNRVSQISGRLIREWLRPGVLVASVFLLSMQANAGNGPNDKDKDRRAPSGPPAPSRSVDSGARSSQRSFAPPSRPVITDSAPRMNRSSGGEGLRGAISNPPSRPIISNPPSRPIVSNPPSGGGSMPAINRNPVGAAPRTDSTMRSVGPLPKMDTPKVSGPMPKIDSPKVSGPLPTVGQPKISGPLPPVTRNPAGGTGVSGGGTYSPATAPQPGAGLQGGKRTLNGDLRLEAQRGDVRNGLNDKRQNGPGNSGSNQKIEKPANQNIKMPDRPVEKPRDPSPGGSNLIEKGRLDRNNLPQGGGLKKLDNPNPTLQKAPDSVGTLRKDSNPNLQKGPGVPGDLKKDTGNPGLRKGPDVPGNLKKDLSNPNLQKGPAGPGNLKKDTNIGPQKGGADKIVPPPDAKKLDDRGGLKTDPSGRKDAFQPGRFDRNKTTKDSTLDPKGANIDRAKTGDLTGDKLKGVDLKGDKVKGGTITGDSVKGGNLKGTLPDLRKDKGDIVKPFSGKQTGPQPLKGQVLSADAAAANIKNVRAAMNNKRFDERVKSGELDKVTKGDIAKKIDLSDQFKHMHQGDVARRMDLQHRAGKAADLTLVNNRTIANLKGIPPRHGHFYGSIHPHYVDNCFRYHYWGPSFFAGACWYPHWNPWVVWSWHYQCNSFWDPRPLWCRPIVYTPYIVWNYWQPPAWQPLMDVSCGTWVDVKPVVVEPEKFDLQLLAVRMVDPGHPEEKLGPRYRVWYRNNSGKAITDPFSVMLFAANDKKFGEDLPRAGVRVTSIEAGDTQSVDVRLPIDVMTMSKDADGQPAPFEFLHFFVDANREVNDMNLANNGAVVPRDEMLPVDPAAFEIDPVQAAADNEMIVAGEGLGPQPGQVLLHIGNQEVQAEILGWYDLGVKFAAPKVEIAMPTEAEVIVIRGDGAAANPLKITLLPDNAEGPVLEIPSVP
jgi:hypothetical protein